MLRVTGRELNQVVGLYDIQCRINQYKDSYNESARETAQAMQNININYLWMITQE